MFQTKYYKEDNLYKIDILLTDITVGAIEAKTIREASNIYIDFEERYFNFTFSDKEKELKIKNAELIMELNETQDESLLDDIIDVNEELQHLYIQSGFEQIRKQHEADYKIQLLAEINNLGGDINE